MESIVLIGFMGAGKTTIGQSLANKLKMPHLDLDTALIEKIGRSIPDYFEKPIARQKKLSMKFCNN